MFALVWMLCSCEPACDFVIADTVVATGDVQTFEKWTRVLINKNSYIYHLSPDCPHAARVAQANRLEIEVPNVEYLSEHGYEPCSKCSDLMNYNKENK